MFAMWDDRQHKQTSLVFCAIPHPQVLHPLQIDASFDLMCVLALSSAARSRNWFY